MASAAANFVYGLAESPRIAADMLIGPRTAAQPPATSAVPTDKPFVPYAPGPCLAWGFWDSDGVWSLVTEHDRHARLG